MSTNKISKVDYLFPDDESTYAPKKPDWERIKNYVNVEYDTSILIIKSWWM